VAVTVGKIIISSPKRVESGQMGLVYVYTNTSGNWIQNAVLVPTIKHATEEFGTSIAISANENVIIVGGPNYYIVVGIYTVSVIIFKYNSQTDVWDQDEELDPSDSISSNAYFGSSVAISADGKQVLVGAPMKMVGIYDGKGQAYVYR